MSAGPVEVVVCPDFASEAPSKVIGGRKRPAPRPPREERAPARAPKVIDFRSALDSVVKLGATKFNKKEKKAFEERRVTTLGGHAEKNEKMPFKMLLALRDSGITQPKSQKKRKTKRSGGGGDSSSPLPGRMTGGVMHVKAPRQHDGAGRPGKRQKRR